MSDARFGERRRRDRHRRFLRWGIGALVAVALLAAVWVVWFSDVLGVRTVEVSGIERLGPERVKEAADVPAGEPLARLDLVAIETRVSRLQVVESVEVERDWPRTVRIVVTERSPVAWTRVDGDIRAVDRFGVDYRTLDREPRGLVEVTTDATDPRQRQLAVSAATTVIATLRADDPELMAAVRGVDAPSRDAVTLRLTKGRTVTWGSTAKSEQKLEVLDALLAIPARGYDVSAPEQPTTRE